jgi:hypothetical protein
LNKIVKILVALLVAAVLAYLSYVKVFAKAILYYGYKLISRSVGKPIDFSNAVVPTNSVDPLPVGTYVSFDVAQSAPVNVPQDIMSLMNESDLNDLAKSAYAQEMELVYTRISWNQTPDGDIRDFRFGVVYRLLNTSNIQRVSDNVGNVVWLKTVLDTIDNLAILSKQAYILTQ